LNKFVIHNSVDAKQQQQHQRRWQWQACSWHSGKLHLPSSAMEMCLLHSWRLLLGFWIILLNTCLITYDHFQMFWTSF
jgi:hypothetical protein